MSTNGVQERWGRETRLLVLVVVVSLAVLLVLAQLRFPSPNLTVAPPVQGPLAGLAGRTAFDDLGASLNTLLSRVAPRLINVRVKGVERLPVRGNGRAVDSTSIVSQVVAALRLRSNLTVLFMPAEASAAETNVGIPLDVIAQDKTREVALVNVTGAEVTPDPAPTVFTGFTYVGVVSATPSGLSVTPVFVGRADRAVDPLWRGVVFVVDGGADLRVGAFAFTMDGHLVGLVARGSAGVVIVPAETLGGVADELARSGTGPA